METLWQDVRFTFRTLAKSPGFSVVAVLVLGLGIGTTTAVFSVVNAVLIRPLPYRDPARLVAITSVYQPGKVNRSVPVIELSELREWQKRSRMVESMGAFAYTQLPIQVGEEAHSPVTALVDPEFLPTLGDQLGMGTTFAKRSETSASDNTVVITHRFWLDAFHGDPAVIGRSLRVDGFPFTVRGVLRAGFQFPRSDASYFRSDVDLLLPADSYANFPQNSRQWFGVGRLKSGMTLAQAESELRGIVAGIAELAPDNRDWTVRLTPLAEETASRSRQALLSMLGISIVLVLIAATNLMNLLFSRGASRLRELAIRKAIGSTTGRLIRQLLTESICLAGLGGAAGIFVAWLSTNALVALSPVHLPVSEKIDIDVTVLAFTFVICAAAALAAGFFPAIYASVKCDDVVRHPGERATTGKKLARLQEGLCVTQMALGLGLLAAAGLLAHSLWQLRRVDPGFRSEGILGFSVSVPGDRSMDQRKRFYQQALDDIRSIAGVTSAGWISYLPPETRAGTFIGITLEPSTPPPSGLVNRVNHMISGAGYFSTVGISLARGRDFSRADTAQSQPVIIVNETLAQRYFPNQDPLGRKIGTVWDGSKPVREIIGIVKDTHDRGLGANPIPTLYIPFPQFALGYGSIAVRTQVTPTSIVPEIRRRLSQLDPGIPLTDFQTLDDRIFNSMDEPRFYTVMAVVCASMAVFFVSLGLYGVISFSVSRRTAEFGVRMAVGAGQPAIVRMVLLQGLRIAGFGVPLGFMLSLLFTRVLTSFLFQVRPIDVVTLVPAALFVVVVTAFASYLPARRASRVNPIVALRYE